jgi:glucokinase-like ROK family protein
MTEGDGVLIGIDIGCTTISGGLVTADGTVLSSIQVPTKLGSMTGVDTVLDIVARLRAEADTRQVVVEAVGIGMPGLVDVEQGMLKTSAGAYVADFHGVPIAERITAKTGLPAFLDNDVNALALGEALFGPGRGSASCVVLAIGSGVGGGIILDGRIVRGKSGYAGEFGHVSLDVDGEPCSCGGHGCIVLYSGGHYLAETAQRRIAREPSSMLDLAGGDPAAITAETIFTAARSGDGLAASLVARACQAIGAAIGVIVNTLDPEVVVITGGVVTSLVHLQDDILRCARDYTLADALAGTRIHVVPGAKTHTVRGGAALVLYERARRAGRA